MTNRQWIIAGGLLILVVLALVGLVLTEPRDSVVSRRSAPPAAHERATRVDQRPLQTARKLAALASTPEEQRIARDILRLADREVDQAFADALRDAQEHPPQLNSQTKELNARVDRMQAAVKLDQERVRNWTKRLAEVPENSREIVQQRLDLSQAQLLLDQDELDDAKEDLIRAGGDPQSNIQRLLEDHEASEHAGAAVRLEASTSAQAAPEADNLAAQVRAWNALREKRDQLAQALQDTLRAAAALAAQHETLERRVKQEDSEKQAVARQTAGMTNPGQNSGTATPQTSAAATISSLHHFSEDQKALSGLDKRIRAEQELGSAYGSWIALVQSRRRAALHRLLQSALWILLILLVLYLVIGLIDRYFTELTPEKKRLLTIRVVVRFAVEALGVLLILFVILGAPGQTPTILGLAGAGLTVALKDFIVAFFGWFVLMGRNGIRVGDWVEINGVGGEVVEIGLLRTVLLETGNWADAGHPTGRKVAFVNSYAVEGHYFNFSTSGQWLWDEIRILIPSGENPYPMIDSIQKLVTMETQANAGLAEQEWQRAASRYRVWAFSAAPSINVRPTHQGVEVVVRYIVRAPERHAVRARLHQQMVEILHRKYAQAAAANLHAPSTEQTGTCLP